MKITVTHSTSTRQHQQATRAKRHRKGKPNLKEAHDYFYSAATLLLIITSSSTMITDAVRKLLQHLEHNIMKTSKSNSSYSTLTQKLNIVLNSLLEKFKLVFSTN